VPFGFDPVLRHWPLQHSPFTVQTSPNCAQKETSAEHMPLLQKPEQQSALAEQPSPEMWHVELIDAHLPPVHTPLQHWLPEVQFPATGLSWTQAVVEQTLFTQKPEQQSEACAQVAASAVQAPPLELLHTFGVGTPQTPPLGQVAPLPHLRMPPQPSETKPQLKPAQAAAALRGVQLRLPHTFATPPAPHVCDPVQVPQLAVRPPQPSAT
jgi:hypothetical protein